MSVAAIATYCRSSTPRYVIGSALPRRSRRSTHSSRPVAASSARNRLSSVAAMNSRPPAVTMAAARPGRPVFRLPAGSVSVTPTVRRHATSPVATSTAVNWPHGGFWHGIRTPSTSTSKPAGRGVRLTYGDGASSSSASTIQPRAPTSIEKTKAAPVAGSNAAPPQFGPPTPPGKFSVVRGAAPAGR